ncbi:hypothetical protein AHiyo4_07220 [Arthrobacter sp. Hiyo4]|nr:hypothetical protein AHiyo4_07220 [Arthrobacter sp. Hiyo4]
MDFQRQDVGIRLRAAGAGAGKEREVRVGAADGTGPARSAKHVGGIRALQEAVEALLVPGPCPEELRSEHLRIRGILAYGFWGTAWGITAWGSQLGG